jgi:ectoine hydroxylase-related dioxygenase (phytanoyl-CoA dioxygenase family)
MAGMIAAPSIRTADSCESGWLNKVLVSLECVGFAIVEQVLDLGFLEETRKAMYRVQEKIQAEIGLERLRRANEIGVLRLMMRFDPIFFRYLEIPQLLTVLDNTIGNTAILHTQNGFILPPFVPDAKHDDTSQLNFHMDFPRVLNHYQASINVMFAIDQFTAINGGTLVVPGSHQKVNPPDAKGLATFAIPVECPAGSMFVFDSTLWHAAGKNVSGADRLAINHQFTRSYIKQQIDYVRAIGEETIVELPDRSQQILGHYTRVVTSLDEYYRPESERLYRRGQG